MIKIFAFFKGQRIVRKDKIVRPSILLSNHTSFYDFIYTIAAAYPYRVSYLAADKMFYDPLLGKFLRMARAIPKCLFQSDYQSVKATLTIIKKRGIVSIFPEGQISAIGKTYPLSLSIAKLLKKVQVDVFVIKHHNAYFVNPPWSKKTFRGRINTTVEKILSPENLQEMSLEVILQIIEEKLAYNATSYNATHQYNYKLNDITNLDSLIYRCPHCKTNGLIAKKHHLHCPTCEQELFYDAGGKLGKWGLFDLYQEQEQAIQEVIEQNPEFMLENEVVLESYKNNRVETVGAGILRLTPLEYIYQGTLNEQKVELRFETKATPFLPSDIGRNIQIYDQNILYQFVFEDKKMPTIYVIAGEYLYRKQNPRK